MKLFKTQEAINGFLKKSGLKQVEVARYLGISRALMSAKINFKSKWNYEEGLKIAKLRAQLEKEPTAEFTDYLNNENPDDVIKETPFKDHKQMSEMVRIINNDYRFSQAKVSRFLDISVQTVSTRVNNPGKPWSYEDAINLLILKNKLNANFQTG